MNHFLQSLNAPIPAWIMLTEMWLNYYVGYITGRRIAENKAMRERRKP